jgi:hypothetical protein
MVDTATSCDSSSRVNEGILAKLEAHLYLPEIFDLPATTNARVAAVREGDLPYPSLPPRGLHGCARQEVRYMDPTTSSEQPTANQAIFLDYGIAEASVYPSHAVALDELSRLASNQRSRPTNVLGCGI